MCARGMHERLQPCVPEACMRGCSHVWLQGERDWLHANSVDWTLGPDGFGYVLISYNVPSEVVVVRWPAAGEVGEAGEAAGEGESGILFRFGNPLVARTGDRHARQLFCQHSAKWVQGSHGAGVSSLRFILFNNGCAPHRRVLHTRGRQPLPHRGRQPLPTRAPRNDPVHRDCSPTRYHAPRHRMWSTADEFVLDLASGAVEQVWSFGPPVDHLVASAAQPRWRQRPISLRGFSDGSWRASTPGRTAWAPAQQARPLSRRERAVNCGSDSASECRRLRISPL